MRGPRKLIFFRLRVTLAGMLAIMHKRVALEYWLANITCRIRYTVLAVSSVSVLVACDGAAYLCGDYACLYYQSSCDTTNTCGETKQCEAAGNIRDRAPRIINELREAKRACSVGVQSENRARLVWDADLATASELHSRDMAENRFESFNGTDGLSSAQRVDMTGFSASIVAESIVSGPQTAAEAINYWLDIEADCKQLLSENTTRIGMACNLSDSPDPTPYWSLLLANPTVNGIRQ